MTKISAATDGKNMLTYANMEPRFWDQKKVISLFDWKHFPSTAMMTLLHAQEFLNQSRLAAGIPPNPSPSIWGPGGVVMDLHWESGWGLHTTEVWWKPSHLQTILLGDLRRPWAVKGKLISLTEQLRRLKLYI